MEITSLKWSRIEFEGKGHDHSFLRDGDEKVVVTVDVDASSSRESPKVDLVTGLKGLLGGSRRLRSGLIVSSQDWWIFFRGVLQE